MNEHDIRNLVEHAAKEAAHEAVKETLLKLGIKSDDALEVQADMQHLRAWREASNTIKRQGLMTAVGVITIGILGLIWIAIKGSN